MTEKGAVALVEKTRLEGIYHFIQNDKNNAPPNLGGAFLSGFLGYYPKRDNFALQSFVVLLSDF